MFMHPVTPSGAIIWRLLRTSRKASYFRKSDSVSEGKILLWTYFCCITTCMSKALDAIMLTEGKHLQSRLDDNACRYLSSNPTTYDYYIPQ
ncbi:hypothetical protein BDN71DRAFT_1458741 [Pleurotus eryngii]|uniref:Uncharacterized protein n=1 Tax=Pleurotus eryngii TaxID=5323 RepID=A0A9P5ZFA1_PLEER|nr:hypothetical protein BDN71DRAFT_1458741 [Pleurotus eryngii]